MPKILIKELDLTTAAGRSSNSFSVVVPGLSKLPIYSEAEKLDGEVGGTYANPAIWKAKEDNCYYYIKKNDDGEIIEKVKIGDETGICRFANAKNFEKYIGKSFVKINAATDLNKTVDTTKTIEICGNQCAYLLLKQGYVVYFILVGCEDDFVNKDALDSSAQNIVDAGENLLKVMRAKFRDPEVKSIKKVKTKSSASNEIDIDIDSIYGALTDKSIYDFRYIMSGVVCKGLDYTKELNEMITAVAEKRGDCIALLDIDEGCYIGQEMYTAIQNIREAASAVCSKYAAYFVPSVIYNNISDGFGEDVSNWAPAASSNANDKLPAYMHYLFCARKSFENNPEWFAVAGAKRGVSDMSIKGLTYRFGDKAVQLLQPRADEGTNPVCAVNVIVTNQNANYLWGNRTAHSIANSDGLIASDFLNIRQLVCTLKKQIYIACRNLMFDPNSDVLWLNFCGAISGTLERMKSLQGIRDYRLEKKDTDMKAKLFAAVRIVPIEAVEDFEIAITLEDNLDEPSIAINEDLGEYTYSETLDELQS